MSTTYQEAAVRASAPATRKTETNWLERLVRTEDDVLQTVLRVTLGVVMLPHAAQKMFGWFGGYGIEGTMGYLTGAIGLPAMIAALVIAFEFGGAVALITGLAGRLGALAIGIVMIGAVWTSHLQNGFFMNWSGTQAGEGFEYHLLALAMAAVIAVKGSGALSFDRMLARRVA